MTEYAQGLMGQKLIWEIQVGARLLRIYDEECA